MEQWKDILGYEGYYQVSSLGAVRRLPISVLQGNRRVTYQGRILKAISKTSIYPAVVLSKNGHHKSVRVHRLVASAFIPNLENHAEINHVDGNRFNNSVENLEWVSPERNKQHAIDTGLTKCPPLPKERAVIQIDANGNIINTFTSAKNAAIALGKNETGSICKCCKGHRKQAYGFSWSYAKGEVLC